MPTAEYRIIALAQSKHGRPGNSLPDGYSLRAAAEKDADELAAVYKQVFASCPLNGRI